MTGLRVPRDLAAWRRWQARRTPARTVVRGLRSRLRSPDPVPVRVQSGEEPDILIVVEAEHASVMCAVGAVVEHLTPARLTLVTHSASTISHPAPARTWSGSADEAAAHVPRMRRVLTASQHSPLGELAAEISARDDSELLISQHGLLTPFAPPLPPGCRLLAWTESDADYWRSGRDDVTTRVVGSQLLHRAAHRDPVTVPPGERPTYLGQLHAAELPKHRLVRAAGDFCRRHDATYRPHPSERDRLSVLVQRGWEHRGIRVDRSGVPLDRLDTPIVSVFSTGVLEAAARGIPAWVDFPSPPPWLSDFWHRYGMQQFGGPATPPPPGADAEPATTIARILEESP